MQVRRNGEKTEGVEVFLVLVSHSVTLMERNPAVMIDIMENAATRQNTVLVRNARTTDVSTESGGNQEAKRSGGTTEGVALVTVYRMAQLLSVTLTGITHVVTESGRDGVVTPIPARVSNVQTIPSCTRTGGIQENDRCGDTTAVAAVAFLHLMARGRNAIRTAIHRAVSIFFVPTTPSMQIACVTIVWTIGSSDN